MTKLDLQIDNDRSVSQLVCDTLRDAIIRGVLQLGERLVEAKIAAEMKVSITPVRQAFGQLSKEGLIIVFPYKGTYVISITDQLISEVYSMRKLLEIQAVELALPHLSDEDCKKLQFYANQMEDLTQSGFLEKVSNYDILFHGLIYDRSGHTILMEMWRLLQSRIQLLQSYGRMDNRMTPKGQVYRNHTHIVNAIQTKDISVVRKTITDHIDFGEQLIRKHLIQDSLLKIEAH